MTIIQPLAALCLLIAVMAECSQGGSLSSVGKQPVSGKDYPKGPVQERGGWEWQVGAGPSYRSLGGVDFRSDSYSSSAFLPRLRPSISVRHSEGSQGSDVGPVDSFADRRYRDGFVFIDDNTTNPESFLPGTTAYWGHVSDSQVQDGSLRYSGGDYRTLSFLSGGSSSDADWSSDLDGASPVFELGAFYPVTGHLRLGGMMSFLFSNFDASHSSAPFHAFQTLKESFFSVSDWYDLQGVTPPEAPYSGSFDHPGTAPLIDNLPSQRRNLPGGSSRQSATYINQVEESLKIDLYTFSFGPTLRFDAGRFALSGSLGLAVNVAAWEASFQERLYQEAPGARKQLREWSDRRGDTDILPGFFLQGSAGYDVNDHWQVSVFGRYDWSESLTRSIGPSDFSADFGGFTLGGGLTFTF
jgi:hypothetical protein